MIEIPNAPEATASNLNWPKMRATSLSARLIKQIGKKHPRYALVLSGETDFIGYFAAGLQDELRVLSPEPFLFVEAGPDGHYADQPDLVLFVSHGSNHAAKLWRLRETFGPDVVLACWFWDNHVAYANNLHTAIAADVIYPSHGQNLDYLFNPVSVLAGHIPACSAQWTREEAHRLFEEFGTLSRQHKLLANYVDYNYSTRGEVLRILDRDVDLAEVLLMPRGDRSRYFGKTARDRFAEWCNYKATIILPVTNDLSTRLFDALLAGMVPVVPSGIPDFDSLIPRETQIELGVVRIDSFALTDLKAATVEALRNFDSQGATGVLNRHCYVLENHMLINRVTSMLYSLWMHGQGAVSIEFGDGNWGPALYQVRPD